MARNSPRIFPVPDALPLVRFHEVAHEYGHVPAGTIVTTGTWSGCQQLQAGDRFSVKFEGLSDLAWQF